MSEEKIRHIIEVFENDYCEKCSEFNCLEGSMEEIITAMKQLQQENQELKKQLDYLRSGEYYNQLRFENEMLQQVVDTNGVPSEVYDYIDCTHRNTELLKENQELKKQLEVGEQQYNDLVEEKEILQEQLSIKTLHLEELKLSKRDYTQENILTMQLELKNRQQKEFIEYLTSYIDLLSNKPDLIEEAEIDILEEILSKYKSIIGGK